MSVRSLILLFALSAVTSGGIAFAAIDTYEFANEEIRQRFYQLNAELRCPKCQNQSLGDSDSPISTDLRAEVYRLLGEGKSDAEIKQWLVQRYGDYILYRPGISLKTLALWLTPVVLLLAGILVVILLVRRQRTVALTPEPNDLNEQERQRIKQLLDAEQPPSAKRTE